VTERCELCASPGGDVVWRDGFCRVVLVDDPDYPGFCRVVLERHVREMTDLAPPERTRLMDAVFATEAVLRDLLKPDKINLASLGNAVPHLHWHVIPRFAGDAHFPQSVWGERQRDPDPERIAARHRRLPELVERMRARLESAAAA
jgi:diadenosine tetraphosphate (Ap4A) HIT family hydrolase